MIAPLLCLWDYWHRQTVYEGRVEGQKKWSTNKFKKKQQCSSQDCLSGGVVAFAVTPLTLQQNAVSTRTKSVANVLLYPVRLKQCESHSHRKVWWDFTYQPNHQMWTPHGSEDIIYLQDLDTNGNWFAYVTFVTTSPEHQIDSFGRFMIIIIIISSSSISSIALIVRQHINTTWLLWCGNVVVYCCVVVSCFYKLNYSQVMPFSKLVLIPALTLLLIISALLMIFYLFFKISLCQYFVKVHTILSQCQHWGILFCVLRYNLKTSRLFAGCILSTCLLACIFMAYCISHYKAHINGFFCMTVLYSY